MATKKPVDTVWDEIFDSLVLEAEPPHQYVKKVTITTRDGKTFSISPQDFSALIEQEKHLPPGVGEIQSAKMSLDFNKIKKDVDKWSNDLISRFDGQTKLPPTFSKPKAGKKVTKKAPATKAPATKAPATKASATKASLTKAASASKKRKSGS